MSKPSILVRDAKESASKAKSKVVQDVIRERDNIFSRPDRAVRKKDDPVDALVRMAAAGVGFISEASHYRQEKKKRKEDELINQDQRTNEGRVLEQTSEAIWELDEAAQETAAENPVSQSPEEPNDLAKAFLKRHSHQIHVESETRLALPVILVQRRPKKRARGFVRAYAPVLADMGVDQEVFLDFIDTFNKTLEPNPWLNAINLAGFAGMAASEPFSTLIGIGVEVATDVALEVQSRFRSNKFLDCINSEFFSPRGLICLVATWRPSAGDDELIISANFEGEAVKASSITSDDVKREKFSEEFLKKARATMYERMKPYSGVVGQVRPAPLIFPPLNDPGAAIGQDNEERKKKKNVFDRTGVWVDGYLDKHAQAKWLEKNNGPSIANLLPKPKFRSRYADPSHPATSGDIVSFLTGGRWRYGHEKPAESEGGGQKADPKEENDSVEGGSAEQGSKSTASQSCSDEKPTDKSMRLLESDILYLVILNLPSKGHTAEALQGMSQDTEEPVGG